MPKDVGVNTYLELYFMICILLHVIGALVDIYIYIECKKMRGMGNIKKNYLLCGASIQPPLFFCAFAAAIHRCAQDQIFMPCMMVSIIIQLLFNCFLKTLLSYQADIIGFIMLLSKL